MNNVDIMDLFADANIPAAKRGGNGGASHVPATCSASQYLAGLTRGTSAAARTHAVMVSGVTAEDAAAKLAAAVPQGVAAAYVSSLGAYVSRFANGRSSTTLADRGEVVLVFPFPSDGGVVWRAVGYAAVKAASPAYTRTKRDGSTVPSYIPETGDIPALSAHFVVGGQEYVAEASVPENGVITPRNLANVAKVATPDAPTPDAPTPDAPTPDAPTPDAPTPAKGGKGGKGGK